MQSIAASEVALRRVAGQDQALWNGMGGGGDRGGGRGQKVWEGARGGMVCPGEGSGGSGIISQGMCSTSSVNYEIG